MYILGLTGSIAMGKSTIGKMFERCGAAHFDADKAVHELLARGGRAVSVVEKHFPLAIKGKEIDREMLGRIVFNNMSDLYRLENILHPMVREKKREFIKRCRREGRRIVIMEIPLLYEVGADKYCDAVAVVSAPDFIQRQRVLRRKGMNENKLMQIRARQMHDAEKRRRADFIIHTGLRKGHSLRQVKAILHRLKKARGLKTNHLLKT